MTDELPEGGPGLAAAGTWDPTAFVAIIAGLLGLLPDATFRALFNTHAFGPVAFAAILGIVGVLFGFVAIMRSAERGHLPSRTLGGVAVALGIIRVLLYPMFT